MKLRLRNDRASAGLIAALIVFATCVRLIGNPIQTPPPTLMLDAGGGVSAELSEYSYVPNQSGGGTFCFTLKNTSLADPPKLPTHLVGVGLTSSAEGGFLFPTVLNSPDTFNLFLVSDVNDVPVDFLIAAPGGLSDGSFGGHINGPDGIAIGASGSFCMSFASHQLTLDDLLARMIVVFSNEVSGCYATEDAGPLGFPSGATIHLDTFSAEEVTFRVTNRDFLSGLQRRISGAAFDVPGGRRKYYLAKNSSSQLGGFKFVTAPGQLRQFDGKFDFGVVTQPSNGLLPREAISFKVVGDFANQTTAEILQKAIVDFGGTLAPLAETCPFFNPTGGGVRGTVATIAR